MSLILGLDLGGSSIKAGAVDAATGQLVGETQAAPTPAGAPVAATRDAIAALVARFPQCSGPVGLAFPSVVNRGITLTAANIDRAWIGVDAAALLTAAAGRPGIVVNDADAAFCKKCGARQDAAAKTEAASGEPAEAKPAVEEDDEDAEAKPDDAKGDDGDDDAEDDDAPKGEVAK